MNLKTLENHLAASVNVLTRDLESDLKAEAKHIVDPSQCGSIVRRHIGGILFGVLLLVAIGIAIATVGIAIYVWR